MAKDTYDGVWQPDMLDRFPMNPNVMVADLDRERLDLLLTYVSETGRSESLSTFISGVVERHPKYLRVKELFETFEAYRRIGQAIYEQWRQDNVDTVFDLACGHGLLGVLLAWRFRKLRVVCVDLERRPAFDHYLEILRELAAPMENVAYIESDFKDVELGPRSYVICIHACNEGTRDALDMADSANAGFAAMPCCIRDRLYLRRINHLDDDARYTAAVGVIAGRYGAYKITAIDRRITNRNLILLGAPATAS